LCGWENDGQDWRFAKTGGNTMLHLPPNANAGKLTSPGAKSDAEICLSFRFEFNVSLAIQLKVVIRMSMPGLLWTADSSQSRPDEDGLETAKVSFPVAGEYAIEFEAERYKTPSKPGGSVFIDDIKLVECSSQQAAPSITTTSITAASPSPTTTTTPAAPPREEEQSDDISVNSAVLLIGGLLFLALLCGVVTLYVCWRRKKRGKAGGTGDLASLAARPAGDLAPEIPPRYSRKDAAVRWAGHRESLESVYNLILDTVDHYDQPARAGKEPATAEHYLSLPSDY
jgi:hypothetical protein